MNLLRNFSLSLEPGGLMQDGLCGVLPSLRPRISGPHPPGHGVLVLGGNGLTTPSALDTLTGVHHSSNIFSFFLSSQSPTVSPRVLSQILGDWTKYLFFLHCSFHVRSEMLGVALTASADATSSTEASDESSHLN